MTLTYSVGKTKSDPAPDLLLLHAKDISSTTVTAKQQPHLWTLAISMSANFWVPEASSEPRICFSKLLIFPCSFDVACASARCICCCSSCDTSAP